MKSFLLLLLFMSTLFGVSINESLLKIHATLLPKIFMMDYKFNEKIKNNTLIIAIMYQKSEYATAESLKQNIDTRYKDGVQSYKIACQLVPYSDVSKTDANIYYLFPSDEKNIKHSIQQAKNNSALTFSYLSDDLKYGVMISVNISKKIKPILNLEAIKMQKIAFRPVLLDISSIFIHEPGSSIDNFRIRGLNKSMVYMA